MTHLKIDSTAGILSQIVKQVIPAVTGRSTLPVLNHLLFHSNDGTLAVEGSDLEMWMIRNCPDVPVTEGLPFMVDARLISNLLSKLPAEDTVSMEGMEKGGCVLKSMGRKYALAGAEAEEYPKVPVSIHKQVCVEVSQSALLAMLRQTTYAAADKNSGRPVIESVNFNSEFGRLQVVATDTYRLALSDSGVKCEELSAILPVHFARIVAGQLTENDDLVRIVFDAHAAVFTMGDLTVHARLYDGQYPNYRRVLPTEYTTSATCNREDLLNAAERVMLIGAESGGYATFDFSSDTVRIWVESNSGQMAEEKVAVAQLLGETVSQTFNGKYMDAGLSSFDCEDIRIQFDQRGFARLDDGNDNAEYYTVIVPMTVKGINGA